MKTQGPQFDSVLPWHPSEWDVITSASGRGEGSMSILFGNDTAVRWPRTHSGSDYPSGSVLALVTWEQREDARWFGARIPGQPKNEGYCRAIATVKFRIRKRLTEVCGRVAARSPAQVAPRRQRVPWSARGI